MILSDNRITNLIDCGLIELDPYEPEKQIQGASIDLHLTNEFMRMKHSNNTVKIGGDVQYEIFTRRDSVRILGNSFVLGSTRETIKLPDNIAGFIEGKSTVGRSGLFIQNAGWINPGFEGTLTLELFNANRLPLEIEVGSPICQIILSEVHDDVERVYGDYGKYQGQRGVEGGK